MNASETTAQVESLIHDAVRLRASDIHLEPTEAGGTVRVRVDGVLREHPMPDFDFSALVNQFKAMARFDVENTVLPQDGRIVVKTEGRRLDLRLSTIPNFHGERMCIRILDPSAARLSLDQICRGDHLAKLRALCHRPNGMLLSTGPTGSGKTTTMYAMIQEVNTPETSIFSAEDPVEYLIRGVSQSAIRPAAGLTFATLTRAILRQDPDVVMVGEIRDAETLQVCCQTALTGHLVLSQLHANTAVEAVMRLLEIGAEPFLVNAALNGVVSQRLVRRLCGHCKRPVAPALDRLPDSAAAFLAGREATSFCEPVGCDRCFAGYKGRLAIHEIVAVDDSLRRVVADRGSVDAMFAAARQGGMRTLSEDGLLAAVEGTTSVAEVLRVVPWTP